MNLREGRVQKHDQLGEKIADQEGDIRTLYRLYRSAMRAGNRTYAGQLRGHLRERLGNLRWMRQTKGSIPPIPC